MMFFGVIWNVFFILGNIKLDYIIDLQFNEGCDQIM